ncbi:hypothetical protein LCGC14_2296570, partial [marine sediment metagenome]
GLSMYDFSSNVDRTISFASDTSIFWDEGQDTFTFNKGLSYIRDGVHAASVTQNTLFDALDKYIPTTNQTIPLHGGWAQGGNQHRQATYAIRESSTVIRVYSIRINYSGSVALADDVAIDGSGSLFSANDVLSISW